MRCEEVALLVMAGGVSRRFADADKLTVDLHGRPLGLHTPARLAPMPWRQRLAVARPPLAAALTHEGFAVVAPVSGNGLGDNLALGARHVEAASAVLIVLADMPFVTTTHIQAMLRAAAPEAIVTTRSDAVRSPPVLIGRAYFEALRGLTGDQGARAIFPLAGANVIDIDATADAIADIDTHDDLERWRLR